MDNVRKLIRRTARKLKNCEKEPDFFELARRVENARRDLPGIGKAHNPRMEPLRFGQTPYLKFPETSVSEVDISPADGDTALIYVYFFGLLGVNGPMPLEFTDYVFQRSQNYYDKTLRRFLDIIHHKMLSLFYRAWSSCEQAVSFDRPEDDMIGGIVLSLAGGVGGALPDSLPEHTVRGYSRFFALSVRGGDGLAVILSSFFGLPVRVVERVSSAHDIPRRFRCVPGNPHTAVFGKNAQIGSKYFSCSQKIVVEIGPVPLELCRNMLPGSAEFRRLTDLVNIYLDRPLEYDVRFLLTKDSILQCALGGAFALGRGIWLASRGCAEPELVLNIRASRLGAKSHKQFDAAV